MEMMVSCNNGATDWSTDLTLPSGAYLEYLDSNQIESTGILIYDKNSNLIGAVSDPFVLDSSGNQITSNNIINGTTIIHNVKTDELDGEGTMVVYYYVQRHISYYFSYYGFHVDTSNPLRNNFYMKPIYHVFLSETSNNASRKLCLELSFDSVDQYFRNASIWSYGDRAIWMNSIDSLYYQYLCHFEYVDFSQEWNIEPHRPRVPYA